MTVVDVNFHIIESVPDFHEVISSALGFPDCYGQDEESFFNCLMKVTGNITVNILNYNSVDRTVFYDIAVYILMMFEHQERTKHTFNVRLYFLENSLDVPFRT
ncbi:Barstar (barnase inhibitor) [Phyllobacterium sp. YR620]|uniref:barstar family protein n=1 Tax=Phyllobacterium sp. YR620 TaxID=1881066 RepID=UPI000888595B|nr:barstar family protein [Phyllobacterium sp. YR620]SDP77945.1 Barstar (barnase inhibitor) [Phyllobacterium sp. YR620]